MVREKISKELALGRIAGPFTSPPMSTFRVSPIGVVPKKAIHEYRLIHHLSYPDNLSVNDFIDQNLCSVQYTKFDEAVSMVQKLGKNTMCAKSDIQSAFRLLRVWPGDFDQLGFKFEGLYYFDKCLPMGCAISCALFEKFSSFLQWIVAKRARNNNILHYLDDFLFMGKSDTNQCSYNLNVFLQTCFELGVPIANEKTEGPKTKISFLGLEIDTVSMLVRIPQSKVLEIVDKIKSLLSKKKATLKEIQSLNGSLNFACRAIRPGRPFLRRLINLTAGLTKPNHHVRLNAEISQDLTMWLDFFSHFNGISVFNDRFWVSNSHLELFTDSSGKIGHGFGIYFAGKWAYERWPALWINAGLLSDITLLEFFPILVSVLTWGNLLSNKKVLFRSDNEAVVHIINKQTSKSNSVMVLLRKFTLVCLQFNIMVKAEHVSGVKNSITDSLSRQQLVRFRRLTGNQADPKPTPLSPDIWTLLELTPSAF